MLHPFAFPIFFAHSSQKISPCSCVGARKCPQDRICEHIRFCGRLLAVYSYFSTITSCSQTRMNKLRIAPRSGAPAMLHPFAFPIFFAHPSQKISPCSCVGARKCPQDRICEHIRLCGRLLAVYSYFTSFCPFFCLNTVYQILAVEYKITLNHHNRYREAYKEKTKKDIFSIHVLRYFSAKHL